MGSTRMVIQMMSSSDTKMTDGLVTQAPETGKDTNLI